jgi:hypothetical protein
MNSSVDQNRQKGHGGDPNSENANVVSNEKLQKLLKSQREETKAERNRWREERSLIKEWTKWGLDVATIHHTTLLNYAVGFSNCDAIELALTAAFYNAAESAKIEVASQLHAQISNCRKLRTLHIQVFNVQRSMIQDIGQEAKNETDHTNEVVRSYQNKLEPLFKEIAELQNRTMSLDGAWELAQKWEDIALASIRLWQHQTEEEFDKQYTDLDANTLAGNGAGLDGLDS